MQGVRQIGQRPLAWPGPPPSSASHPVRRDASARRGRPARRPSAPRNSGTTTASRSPHRDAGSAAGCATAASLRDARCLLAACPDRDAWSAFRGAAPRKVQSTTGNPVRDPRAPRRARGGRGRPRSSSCRPRASCIPRIRARRPDGAGSRPRPGGAAGRPGCDERPRRRSPGRARRSCACAADASPRARADRRAPASLRRSAARSRGSSPARRPCLTIRAKVHFVLPRVHSGLAPGDYQPQDRGTGETSLIRRSHQSATERGVSPEHPMNRFTRRRLETHVEPRRTHFAPLRTPGRPRPGPRHRDPTVVVAGRGRGRRLRADGVRGRDHHRDSAGLHGPVPRAGPGSVAG